MIVIPTIVSLLVWGLVAIVLSAVGTRYYADTEQEITVLCFVAYMWPFFAFIAIVLSPVLIGSWIGVALKHRRLSR